jgi:hypothetical protein
MPRMANMSMNVPMPSAKIADPQGTVSSLNEVWPIPRSMAECEKTAQIASAPSTAPTTWAAQYTGTSRHEKRLVSASANVTAGLM